MCNRLRDDLKELRQKRTPLIPGFDEYEGLCAADGVLADPKQPRQFSDAAAIVVA